MKKDKLICFRTNKKLHESLVQISDADRRSLSSMIEMILIQYLTNQKTFPGVEMRKHPRKSVSIPTFINQQGLEKIGKGSIMDISLGGARILIPRDCEKDVAINSMGAKFDIVFDLSNENNPIKMTCESKRVVDAEEGIIVGAAFVDAEFNSYKSLQTHLM